MNIENNQLNSDAKISDKNPQSTKTDKSDGFLSAFLEIAKTVVFVVLFVICFKLFLIQPFRIIGTSMVPTFHDGEYIFIDEISYRLKEPVRGDVIVFRHPDDTCSPYVESHLIMKGIFEGPCKTYIKRIIGLPGDTVEIKNGTVKIYNETNPEGIVLDENYIEDNIKTLGNLKTTVNDGEYFVLGDNRNPNASSDSREWGLLKDEFIVGRAWIRLLPINDFRIFGKTDY